MKYDEFVTAMERIPFHLQRVELYFSGEPLLNKDLIKMIRYLSDKKIGSIISTNGMLLGDRGEELIESGLTQLIIGIDGATKETYGQYRVGGDFSLIVDNVRKITATRRQRNKKFPKITLQFIVMKHNECEIERIIDVGSELRVDGVSLISVSLGTHRIDRTERVGIAERYLPSNESFSRYATDRNGVPRNKYAGKYCPLWKSPVILWNGDVTTCCYDHFGHHVYGNIFDASSFLHIWHSRRHLLTMKEMIRRRLDICKTCGVSTEENSKYIEL